MIFIQFLNNLKEFKKFKEFIVSGCNKHHIGSTGSFITIRFVREGAVAPYSSKTALQVITVSLADSVPWIVFIDL